MFARNYQNFTQNQIRNELKENIRRDNNYGLSQIANMDETSLFINIPNTKTIAKID